jgi:hypothetical protein
MILNAGKVVWIPCEVKPGPFPDERSVRLSSPFGDWVGFVGVSYLQDPILEGQTNIRVLVVDVQNDKFSARIPGEGIGKRLYGDLISKARAFDTVTT